MANVDSKMRTLRVRDELSVDIGRETSRTDQMLTTIQSMQTRLDSLEKNRTEVNTSQANDNGNRNDSTFIPYGNTTKSSR